MIAAPRSGSSAVSALQRAGVGGAPAGRTGVGVPVSPFAGMASRGQEPAPPPGLAAPETTIINGRTYRGQPARKPGIYGQGPNQGYQAGTEWGPDGSVWTPMGDPPGAGGGSGGPGGSLPGNSTFDYSERTIPKVPPPYRGAPPPGPPVTYPHVTGPSPESTRAAEDAFYGRAHGRIGQVARGSMDAVSDEFNARGLRGSRSEGAALQGVVGNAQNENADVLATQAVEGLHRAQAVNDRNYAGDLSQRGQDIGYASTTRGQNIGYHGDEAGRRLSARGQDIDAAQNRATAISRLEAIRRGPRMY